MPTQTVYMYVYDFQCFYTMNKRRYKDRVNTPPTQEWHNMLDT